MRRSDLAAGADPTGAASPPMAQRRRTDQRPPVPTPPVSVFDHEPQPAPMPSPLERPEPQSAIPTIDLPRPPHSLSELGIPEGLVEDLVMRRVLSVKRSTTGEVARALALSASVVQQVTDELRDKNYIEYLGIEGREYRFALTDAGQVATIDRMKISLYASHAPVSVGEYHRVVEAQRARLDLDHLAVQEVFSDLVMPERLIDKIGFALLNDGAMFLYGPPGTGKTSIAERMNRVFDSYVLVPHCIEADGQIVMVFDPVVHKAVPNQPEMLDPRWVLCERPLVIVGGELGMSMLDLTHESVAGVYSPPMQLLANNGILVIDDFGRQTITPEEILNRWIVPLSRDIDYLKLNNGAKFTVPFAVKLVISSNFDPHRLGDDAFLRRLRNKVFVGPCSPESFDNILLTAARDMDVQVTTDAPQYLRDVAMKWVGELRPYIAVDFCDMLRGMAHYRRSSAVMDRTAIDEVADIYFVDAEAAEASWVSKSSLKD